MSDQPCSNIGQYVLNRIIQNGLVRCIDADERPIIFVWQGNSDEIIEAAIREYEQANQGPDVR